MCGNFLPAGGMDEDLGRRFVCCDATLGVAERKFVSNLRPKDEI